MKTVSRRRAITLASSLAAAPLLNSIDSLAQPDAPATVFNMANFTGCLLAVSPHHWPGISSPSPPGGRNCDDEWQH
jgi:hypothetical protein